ncbi:MAG: DUF5335 family protein [Balneolaceae bacterium]|nr:DUF5335 family protein [Balneolaceae bacterium]
MAIRKIEKEDLSSFFNEFAKRYLKDEQPEYADIQVLSEEYGVQRETDWLILEGISYDPKKDILDIKVEKLDHMIMNPVEVYVDEEPGGLITSMEIIQKDGTKNIVEIR